MTINTVVIGPGDDDYGRRTTAGIDRAAAEAARAMVEPMDRMPMAAAFAALRAAAEAAVIDAVERYDRGEWGERGPVNWADLGVYSVEWYLADADEGIDASTGWRVTVAEAASDAMTLQVFVRDALAAAGFGGVEVVTEW